MDALTYFKEKRRMTGKCKDYCSECALSYVNTQQNVTCIVFEFDYPEKAIEIVEKWAKENPVRTYKDVFFEKFPNALKNVDGYPLFDVRYVFGGKHVMCGKFTETWDEEYQDPRP